jgi:basic membrane protein A and related proteins
VKIRAFVLAMGLMISLVSPVQAEEFQPKVAVAYDIGFLGDNSFNDAVNSALNLAKKKYSLYEPFVREVPTNGTAVDRLTRLRFLAKNGYTLIIAVGPGYREAVRRVAMEYTETQFAIINDKTLGQLNISNIYFREDQGAYLAGVVAALSTKRKVVGFVGSEPELLSSFQKGVKSISSKINVVNISYPDEISALQKGLSRVDVAYSTWDGDSTVLTTVLATYSKKVSLIVESPDQYFANLPGAKGVVIASVNKVLNKPIDQLIQAAFANSSLIDVLDESAGIYGREYGVINGGIRITMYGPISNRVKSALTRALNQLKQG